MVRNTIKNHSQSYPLAQKRFDRVPKILVLLKDRQKKKKQTAPTFSSHRVSIFSSVFGLQLAAPRFTPHGTFWSGHLRRCVLRVQSGWACVWSWMCLIFVVWWVSLSEELSHLWVELSSKQQGPQATLMYLVLVKPQAMIYMLGGLAILLPLSGSNWTKNVYEVLNKV